MDAHYWTRAEHFDPMPHLSTRAECKSDALEHETISEKPLWKALTFHHFGLILSSIFGAIAVVIAFFLIIRHATHYLKPYEQKHIIRILVMIPIYAIVSFLSYLHYKKAIYFEVLRDCYEAFAIASFFTLMCHYIAPSLHEQKEYFRKVEPKNWVWPITWMQKCSGGEDKGWLRKPRSGLTWFNVVWISIFQYCFIRPFFTIVAVVAQSQGRYCSSSKDPRYAYIWVAGFEAVSVGIAMYCVVQFYIQLKDDLAPHRPFLKVLCIKLVIFFCFWQSWIISLLTADGGPLKASEQIAGPDLRIGIPSMLTCVEMAIFAVLHLFAFPWKPYDLQRQSPLDTGTDGYSVQPKEYANGPARALLDALNPWDIIKACGRGFRWLFYGARHRKTDSSYKTKLEPVATNSTYSGPTFAGNGEPANASEAAKKTKGSGDSDTTGLLSDAQANPYVHQDSSLYNSAYGLGANAYGSPPNPDSLSQAPVPGKEYGVVPEHGGNDGRFQNFEQQDTTYHSGTDHSYYERPRYYQEEDAVKPSAEWDMFAGAKGPAQKPQGGGSQPPGWV